MGTSCIPVERKSKDCEPTFRRAVVKRRIEIFPAGLFSLKRRVVVSPFTGLGNRTGLLKMKVGVKDGVTVSVKV